MANQFCRQLVLRVDLQYPVALLFVDDCSVLSWPLRLNHFDFLISQHTTLVVFLRALIEPLLCLSLRFLLELCLVFGLG